MALTYTPPVDLGQTLPKFHLPGVDGKKYFIDNKRNNKPILVMFICNHCPYVKAIEDRLIELGKECLKLQVPVFAICSNDPESYPEDSFENLKSRWLEKKYPFPYLHDEDQKVAKLFGAVCTPDFFLYDSHSKLAYRGRLDDSWKDASKVKSQDLFDAIKKLNSNQPLSENQIPSMGCSIKWRTHA